MKNPTLVPPIKCQGIKTKLVGEIKRIVGVNLTGRWIEPFCGSCAVALNVQPKNALLCDSNIHIIQFYKDIQEGLLTPIIARDFLNDQGSRLRQFGENYFYEVRERFNSSPNSLDFLFLNRACFNGVMRFNRYGKFNVPFCRKVDRFSKAYITKITNQIKSIAILLTDLNWEFCVADFRTTLEEAHDGDVIYADPPYAGRHVDYFNTWTDQDENDLAKLLSSISAKFILSTWHSNEFRTNKLLEKNWAFDRFHIFTRKHYYHVGATEDLRHPIIEALITNFTAPRIDSENSSSQYSFFFEESKTHYTLM